MLSFESQRQASMSVCCVAQLVLSGSLPVSVKTIIQERHFPVL